MKKNNSVWVGFVVLVFFLISIDPAWAYFKVAQNHQQPSLPSIEEEALGPEVLVPRKSVFDGKRVVQVGTTPLVEDIVSKGTDLPVRVALEMLLPSRKWVIHDAAKDHTRLDQEITWDHHGSWLEGLDEIGQMQGLNFLVNWTTRSVYVNDADKPRTKKVSSGNESIYTSTGGQSNQSDVDDGHAFKKKESEGPAPAGTKKQLIGSKEKIWTLKKGSLKKQLEEWCQESGFQLNWLSSYDWMVSTEAEFAGKFSAVVESLVKELYRQDTGITAELYMGNKVLVIKGDSN